MDDLAVVIVAGGSARRFGGNKLLLELDGLPLFLHCVRRFLPAAAPGCLVVVHPRGGGDEFRLAAERFLPDAPIVWTAGGAFRCASVQAGLAAIPLREGIVAIHDAARPLASVSLLETLAEEKKAAEERLTELLGKKEESANCMKLAEETRERLNSGGGGGG